MSLTETVQTQVEGLFTADTGGSGLNNSASTAYVRFWKPYRDPFVDQSNGPGNWPAVLTKVDVQSMHSSGNNKYRVRVTFNTKHDRQVAHTDGTIYAVGAAIALAVDGITMGTLNSWTFSPFNVIDETEGQRNTVALEQNIVAECYATRGSTI